LVSLLEKSEDEDDKLDFEWLETARGKTYNTYSMFSSKPATSIDFGCDGYTASCNTEGELLQMTAPCKICGLSTVKGAFEDTPDAILARSQRRYRGKSTFGLKLVVPGNDTLQNTPSVISDRAFFNFRWPIFTTALIFNGCEHSTSTLFSCVMNKTLYQVLRLRVGVKHERVESITEGTPDDADFAATVSITIAGPSRFGCMCSRPQRRDFPICPETSRPIVRRTECTALKKALDLQLFHNGKPIEIHGKMNQNENLDGKTCAIDGEMLYIDVFAGKSTTVVAAWTICDTESPKVTLSCPASEVIKKHVAIDIEDNNAIGFLWQRTLDNDSSNLGWREKFMDFCLIARCVEKILCVNFVPLHLDQDEKRARFQGRPGSSTVTESAQFSPHAPIKSVLPRSDVDFQSILLVLIPCIPLRDREKKLANKQLKSWQVRFLVTVHNFITREHNRNPKEPDSPLSQILSNYLEKIRRHICSTLAFLIYIDYNTLLYPYRNLKERAAGHQIVWRWSSDISMCYYNMITIWYVMRNCPETLDLLESALRDVLAAHIDALCKLLPNIPRSNDVKVKLLRWYYFASVMKIKEKLQHQTVYYRMTEESKIELCGEVESSRHSAYEAMSVSVRKDVPYSYTDEICDRLAFLAPELGLDDQISTSCILLARKRLLRRSWTSTVNNGAVRSVDLSNSQTWSPWEIFALCHQSHLLFWETLDEGEIYVHRKRCYQFLTSETTIVEAWERQRGADVESWFHLDATCIFASVLLDIRKKKQKSGKRESLSEVTTKTIAQEPPKEDVEDYNDLTTNKETNSPIHTLGIQEGEALDGKAFDSLKQVSDGNPESGVNNLITKLVQLLEREDGAKDLAPPKKLSTVQIPYTNYQPPFYYHPGSFVNSLDDSPDLYAASEIQNLHLRSEIQKYLTNNQNEPLTVPDWNTIFKAGTDSADVLRYVSVTDFILKGSRYSTRITGRLDYRAIDLISDSEIPGLYPSAPAGERMQATIQVGKVIKSLGISHVLSLAVIAFFTHFIDGDFVPRSEGGKSTRPVKKITMTVFDRLSKDLQDILGDKKAVAKAKNRLQGQLLEILSDSVSCRVKFDLNSFVSGELLAVIDSRRFN
jgi:hypothetical protein